MTCLDPAKPRTRNAAATRQAILDAAWGRFLAQSYEAVGLRDIAADVGVDVALVSRYFGGKEKLFREVLAKPPGKGLPLDVSAADLPALFTDLATNLDEGENRRNAERLLIIVRSASSPTAAAIVREALRDDVLGPIASMLDGDNADARASLAMAVWMGTTIMRTIFSVEPLCNERCGVVSGKLPKLYAAALSED